MIPILLVAFALQSAAPSVRTLGKGPMSGIDMPRQVVARTADEWNALWRAHTAGRRLGAQPAVDFSREMVVGVFLGTRPTAGYGVEIVRTVEANGVLNVEYVETAPGPDAVAAQVLTAPFHLVAVPRHDGPVMFRNVKS